MNRCCITEFNKTLAVDQAYQSTEEWINTVDVYLDPRGWATAFGDAMQINFPGFCPYRLAEIAVDQCAKIAQSDDEQALGIGLYEDFLYVDIRYNFSVWVENPALLPKDCVNTDKFESRLALRFGQTVRKSNYLHHGILPSITRTKDRPGNCLLLLLQSRKQCRYFVGC